MEDIGTNCFYIVLVDDICDDNITDVLNIDGQIRYDSSHLLSEECELSYVETGDNADITLDGDVEFTLSNDFPLKGAFLTNDAGYVIGYSINTYSFNISTGITFEDGLFFFSLVEGN